MGRRPPALMASLFKDKRTGLYLVKWYDATRKPASKKRSTGCRKKAEAEEVYAAWVVAEKAGRFDPWRQRHPGDGEETMAADDGPEPIPTLDALRTAFLATKSHKAANTRANYERVTGWLTDHVGPKRAPESLTTADVQGWLDSLDVRPVTVHNYARHLRVWFGWATKAGHLDKSPADGLRLPRAPKRIPKALTPEEVEAVAKYAEEHARDGRVRSSAWAAPLIRLGAETGLRRGELLSLTWDAVDLDAGRLTVRCTDAFTSKSGAERSIPLSARARAVLRAWGERGRDGLVFHSCGRPIDGHTCSDVVKRFAVGAGVPSLTPHALRHSCLTWLAQKGVPVPVLKEVAGHADWKTTAIYVSVAADVARDAVCGALDSLRAA